MEWRDSRKGVDRRKEFTQPRLRLLRLKEVIAICGKSRSSVYEAMGKGEFPKPVKLLGNSSGWLSTEIDAWLQKCIVASRPPNRQ